MLRTMLSLLGGAAIGAAALYLTAFQADPDPGLAQPLESAPPVRPETFGGAATLEAAALELAAEPPSADRTLRLAALLIRQAEADPAGAVRLSRRTLADPALTRLLFAALAEADVDAATAELASFSPGEAQELALTLLRSVGNDDARAGRLAQYLPAPERAAFLAEAVAARGEAAPRAALRQALALEDSGARSLALTRLAQIWGRQEPRQALLHLPEIATEQERTAFRDGVLWQWAQFEPVAALEHVADLDPATQQRLAFAMVHQIPVSQLELVLSIAPRLAGQTGATIRQTMVQRLAQEDPAAALAHLGDFPPHERRQIHGSIGHSYGAKDPEGAFAWAQSLQPRDPQVVLGVLNGIAQVDAERAIELALSLPSPGEREQAIGIVSSIGYRNPADVEKTLNRVLGIDEPAVRHRAVLELLSSWSATAPARAFEWLAANQHAVPIEAFQHVASQLTILDPANAASYTSRVPAAARAGWLATVAGPYAQQDPEAALAWLSQYRGDPAYRQAIASVAGTFAQRDGAAAVRLLHESGALDRGALDQSSMPMIMSVVMGWAQHDPAAAAAWSLTIDDARVRMSTLTMTVQQWNARDPDSARRWAFALPPGEARDDALNGLAVSPFGQVTPDEELLAAFSSERARNRAVAQMALRLASAGQQEAARTLVEQRLTDPAERARIIGALEQVRGGMPGFVAPPAVLGPALMRPSAAVFPRAFDANGVVVAPPVNVPTRAPEVE